MEGRDRSPFTEPLGVSEDSKGGWRRRSLSAAVPIQGRRSSLDDVPPQSPLSGGILSPQHYSAGVINNNSSNNSRVTGGYTSSDSSLLGGSSRARSVSPPSAHISTALQKQAEESRAGLRSIASLSNMSQFEAPGFFHRTSSSGSSVGDLDSGDTQWLGGNTSSEQEGRARLFIGTPPSMPMSNVPMFNSSSLLPGSHSSATVSATFTSASLTASSFSAPPSVSAQTAASAPQTITSTAATFASSMTSAMSSPPSSSTPASLAATASSSTSSSFSQLRLNPLPASAIVRPPNIPSMNPLLQDLNAVPSPDLTRRNFPLLQTQQQMESQSYSPQYQHSLHQQQQQSYSHHQQQQQQQQQQQIPPPSFVFPPSSLLSKASAAPSSPQVSPASASSTSSASASSSSASASSSSSIPQSRLGSLPPLTGLGNYGDSQHALADDEDATPVFEAQPSEDSSFFLLEEEHPPQVLQERKQGIASVDAIARGLSPASSLFHARSLGGKLGMLDRAIALHHGGLISALTLHLHRTTTWPMFLQQVTCRKEALRAFITCCRARNDTTTLKSLYKTLGKEADWVVLEYGRDVVRAAEGNEYEESRVERLASICKQAESVRTFPPSLLREMKDHETLLRQQIREDAYIRASTVTEEEGFDVLSVSLTQDTMSESVHESMYEKDEDEKEEDEDIGEEVTSEAMQRLSLLSTFKTRTQRSMREKVPPHTDVLLSTLPLSSKEKAWATVRACMHEKNAGKLEAALLRSTPFGAQLTDMASHLRMEKVILLAYTTFSSTSGGDTSISQPQGTAPAATSSSQHSERSSSSSSSLSSSSSSPASSISTVQPDEKVMQLLKKLLAFVKQPVERFEVAALIGATQVAKDTIKDMTSKGDSDSLYESLDRVLCWSSSSQESSFPVGFRSRSELVGELRSAILVVQGQSSAEYVMNRINETARFTLRGATSVISTSTSAIQNLVAPHVESASDSFFNATGRALLSIARNMRS